MIRVSVIACLLFCSSAAMASPPVCDREAATAAVAQSQAALDNKMAVETELPKLRAYEASLVEQIRLEKSNPGGVVDLELLHYLGNELTTTRQGIAASEPRIAYDRKIIASWLARAKLLIAGCGK